MVSAAAAAAGLGLSRAPTAQDFYFSTPLPSSQVAPRRPGRPTQKRYGGMKGDKKENKQISGVGPIGLPRFGELGTTNRFRPLAFWAA